MPFRYVISGLMLAGCILLIVCRNSGEKYVAEVLDTKISAQEFAERYKAYLAATGGRDNILLRKQILDNMVNEHIILDDVKKQKLDRDPDLVKRMEEFRRQTILLEYAKRITLDTMSISDDELKKEFRSYNTRVHARYVYAPTEDSAWALKERLEDGATFDALAKVVFQDPGLANNGGDLRYFGWGEMEPALEQLAFSLPVGALSEPVKLRMGYAIVKVENRVQQPLASETDFAKVKEKLAGAIQKRKVVDILSIAAGRIRNDLSPKFNEQSVNEMYANWKLLLEHGDVPLQRETRIADITAKPLVSFDHQSWTIGESLKRLQQTSERQRKRVKSAEDVKEFITGVLVRDVNLRRAAESEIEKDSTVQENIRRQEMELRLNAWKTSVEDTVGRHGWDEALLRKHYEEKKNEYVLDPEVNTGEILVRSEKEAAGLMRRIRIGANFSTLARKHSIRLWAARRGGELGFGAKSVYGIWGDTIFAAEVGQVLGPLWVDPYYGIFKILAKRPARTKSFDECRNDIVADISFLRKQETFKQAVGQLRNNSRVVVDEELLANITIN
ncbi:MAG TPA: peptidylprolyl isomerase [Bacteroidota bacterium]|jgi:parvulin-like peptidyl-prolyl isomerase|nr:peptidylprolyl isomerase [Bacteroidota bacterium]